jgi:hypothetical protein
MEESKISRIGEIQGILGKSPELGEKFNGFPRNRVVVGSENWGKQARAGVQRSMAVVLAVPAKKENGNLGACLIMATDMGPNLINGQIWINFLYFWPINT